MVIGNAAKLTVEAIVDTGFNGQLCLPIPIAIELGLQLAGVQEIELADGTTRDELVFTGQALFEEKAEPRRVRIFLTRATDAMLGTELLQGKTLEVNFKTGKVCILSR
ncbi:MAG: hypothetical protein ACE5MB_03050 [Anaerolineae bacterium]